MKFHANKPEMAGVSIPSPISMHMPSIAIKSNTLLATTLFSKNLQSLLWFSELALGTFEFELTRLLEITPIFIFLQSSEYRANVPPATKHSPQVKT